VHLALEAGCWEGLGTRRPVLDGENGVALLEGQEGEENLNDRGHIAAVVSFRCAWAYLREGSKTPVTEVLQSCEARSKDGLEVIPRLICEFQVKIEVMFDLQVVVPQSATKTLDSS
jgi:hypothetical protein